MKILFFINEINYCSVLLFNNQDENSLFITKSTGLPINSINNLTGPVALTPIPKKLMIKHCKFIPGTRRNIDGGEVNFRVSRGSDSYTTPVKLDDTVVDPGSVLSMKKLRGQVL